MLCRAANTHCLHAAGTNGLATPVLKSHHSSLSAILQRLTAKDDDLLKLKQSAQSFWATAKAA
jgi:hypothetical protein